MKIIHTISELKAHLDEYKSLDNTIGLVPTMGALHEGHIRLVERCVQENNICVVSVFVNPTQFNDKNDLISYPRTPEQDAEMLRKAGCKFIFMPSAEEMYPEADTRVFEFGALERVMEGSFRPGHFNGVAQIVSKLFDIVMPNRAYFGEKDFQQLAIIRKMTSDLALPIEIVPCPIVREKDGLAMSSRNRRLSSEEREKAPLIAQLLFKSATFVSVKSIPDTISFVKRNLEADPTFRLEYFEIVDGDTLQPVESWEDSNHIVGCIAVFCGPVRLIDNIVYRKSC
ncbi:MAG TPA: pantoate--beta-alanine ligase [Bacteroidales bacterium]|nr:pantoate--beta-alanine ligase [Bacteroidales bacterium]